MIFRSRPFVAAQNTAGDTTIVPAIEGKRIRVRSLMLTTEDIALVLSIKSGSTIIAGPLPIRCGFGIPSEQQPELSALETGIGEALVFTAEHPGTPIADFPLFGGWISYWEV